MSKFNFSAVSAFLSQLPNFILIGLLIVGGLFAYKEFKTFMTMFGIDLKGIKDARFDEQQRKIDELNRQYLQISQNIARAQTNIISEKDIEKMFRQTIDKNVQDLVEQNKEQVEAIGKAIAILESNLTLNVKADGERTFVTPSGDTINIFWTYAYADSQEGKRGLRIAQVTFDDTNKEFDNYSEPLKFVVTSVRTKQVSGTPNHYIEFGAYNPLDKTYDKDSPYKFGVDTFVVFEHEIDNPARFFFPQLHVEGGFASGSNFNFGERAVGFDIGLSLGGYGLSEDDNYLRFLRFGIGLSNSLDESFGSFSPIGLNVKTLRFVPFLKDTYIFPGLSFQKSRSVGFAASVSTTF